MLPTSFIMAWPSLSPWFQYVHNGSDSTRDRFTLVARTESKTSVPAAVHVRVIPVDDETPQVVNNTGIRVHAGASVAVTKEQLGELVRDILGLCLEIVIREDT